MKNSGKIFENDFIKSMPDYVWHLRIPDAAQSFVPNTGLRFSLKNPFDFLVWNPNTSTLYTLELKTTQGKSISFERQKGENKMIHLHQIDGLTKVDKYNGIISGFVIEFRAIEKTIFLPISEFIKFIGLVDKSSLNYDDLIKFQMRYIDIPQKLLKKHYRYNVECLFESNVLEERIN